MQNNESRQKIIIKNHTELAPGIFVYDDVINNSKELIDLALSSDENWEDSRVGERRELSTEIRKSRVIPIPAIFSNDIKWFEVAQIIWHHANEYGFHHEIGFSNMEYLQLLHYQSGDGYYKPHSDSGPGLNRIFSAVLYLNEVVEGGETYFNKFDILVKPKPGRLIIFPANYIYIHEARPPISNDKFAIVTWFNPVI